MKLSKKHKPSEKHKKNPTYWGVKKFEKWCEKRKITMDLKPEQFVQRA